MMKEKNGEDRMIFPVMIGSLYCKTVEQCYTIDIRLDIMIDGVMRKAPFTVLLSLMN